MLPYWLLFSYFGLGALLSRPRANSAERFSSPALILGAVFIALMIGFRYRVGTDWPNYVLMFHFAGVAPLPQVLERGEWGYMLLNWLVQQAGGPFWLVNLVCAAVFSVGLYRFACVQSDPWLAALVAIPYLVIVVAMGYTRQGVAMGILMAGLADLLRNRAFWRYFIYVAAATLFHSSAAIALPLAIIGLNRQRLAQFTVVPALGYVLYTSILSSELDKYISHYINQSWNSQGAFIRVTLCLIPAIICLLYRKVLRFSEDEWSLWRNYSIAAFGLAILFFLLPSSTAVDRVALYVLPLEIAVLPRLTFLTGSRLVACSAILVFSFALLFVWLNYAVNARDWLPYDYSFGSPVG